ncbi:hypothetical protein BCR35DRAFT_351214 [Leucosporidium creatinivorum]|uniref:Peptidase A2 domain-containing protein n=1 Tax=Leucosporidium creatinivorum TaxID=106004 RepID=A0A1Y2FVQ5_9BASI|nr:hypothetical protein BCR35DRAFT_351214 [Leucosporidium creatinivorum]
MAESLAYAGSPFAEYLADTGADDQVLQDSDAPSYAELDNTSVAGSDAIPRAEDAKPPSPLPSPMAASPTPKSANDHFSDLLKYSLATSALLHPRLSDALPLYPQARAARVEQQRTAPSSPTVMLRSSSSRRSNLADWGDSWDTRGHGWADRGALGNATFAVRGVVGAVSRLVKPPNVKPVIATIPSARDLSPAPPTVHSTVLATVERLVSAAQELDVRTARALNGIREVECITYGLGLSDPLPPISRIEAQSLIASPPLSASLSASTSSARPRVPSPLGFSPSTFPSQDLPSPPPMRALPLRKILSETLDSTTDTLTAAQAALSAITGFSSPSPTRDTLELSRHEAQAQQDRIDAEARERELEELALEKEKADKAKRMSWNSEPSLSESTFGGIERKTSIRNRTKGVAATATGGHRVRPSIGTVGVFGVGTAAGGADSLSSPTRKQRRRPASLGVWPGQSLSYALRDHDESCSPQDSPIKRKPTKEREQELADQRAEESFGLMALQDAFEEMHDSRRVLLWRMMELVDRSVEPERWVEVGRLLDRLTGALRQAASRVAKGVEVEFGNSGLGSDKLALGRSTSKRMSGMDFGAAGLPSPPRSRPLSLVTSSPQLKATSLRSSPNRPPSVTHARQPSRPSFAPPQPSPSQTSLAALEQRNTSISVALRTIAAKIHVVQDDAKRRVGSPSSSDAEVDRLLATHDSIRTDLEALLREWEDSRVALRGVVKPAEVKSSRSEEDEEEAGSTSLDIIPDVELEEEAPLEAVDAGMELISSEEEESVWPPPQDMEPFQDDQEQVYEAVAGTSSTTGTGGAKPTREERIRAMKEAREAPSPPPSGLRLEAGMVEELRSVLDRRRPEPIA